MTKTTIIPIGPYHPLQEEPEFFKLHVEGEKVVKLDIELGYNHRGIEKLSESKTFEETVFLVERICGICSTSHPFACVKAVEEAGRVEVPDRARFIRTVIGELERLHSHMLWLGLAGHFLGFNTVWMWVWRYRDSVLDIFELISGNRNHYAMMKPGGVRKDIKKEDIPAIQKMLDGLKKPLTLFKDTIIDDPVIRARTKGVGVLTKKQAIDYGTLGPTARASGIKIDVRKDYPLAAYGEVDWDIITTENGDVYDKVIVRILEMFESIKIIEQCIEKLKHLPGPIDSNPKEIPPGEGIGLYEAPRGEVFHYIKSDGGNRPVRHKVRAPSYMNVPSNQVTVLGENVADAAIILAAVDPCYCCTERMSAVNNNTGAQVLSYQDLLKRSKQKTEDLKKQLGRQGPELPPVEK
jgi:membrane-bound hydrogenase subunit alpha